MYRNDVRRVGIDTGLMTAWKAQLGKRVCDFMSSRGYVSKECYYLLNGGRAIYFNRWPEIVYESRGKALDVCKTESRVYIGNMWSDVGDSVNSGDKIYGVALNYESVREWDKGFTYIMFASSKNIANEVIEVAKSETGFDSGAKSLCKVDNVKLFMVSKDDGHYPDMEFPVVAQIVRDEERDKLIVDVNVKPDLWGHHGMDFFTYPDRRWEGVESGWAVIYDVVKTGDHYAFVTGKMLERRDDCDVDALVTELCNKRGDYYIICSRVEWDTKSIGTVHIWECNSDMDLSEKDFAPMTKDSSAARVYTFQNFCIAMRFGPDCTVESLCEKFVPKDVEQVLSKLPSVAVNSGVAKNCVKCPELAKAISDGIFVVRKDATYSEHVRIVPDECQLYKLYSIGEVEFNAMVEEVRKCNTEFIEWMSDSAITLQG